MNQTSIPPVGAKIRQAREKLSIDIEQCKNLLKISDEKIKIIEEDLYENNTVNVYFKGYIRTICRHLELDSDEIITELDAKGFNIKSMQNQTKYIPFEDTASFKLKPKTAGIITLGIIGVVFIGKLANHTPTNQNANSATLELISKMDNGKKLSLQDLSISKVITKRN